MRGYGGLIPALRATGHRGRRHRGRRPGPARRLADHRPDRRRLRDGVRRQGRRGPCHRLHQRHGRPASGGAGLPHGLRRCRGGACGDLPRHRQRRALRRRRGGVLRRRPGHRADAARRPGAGDRLGRARPGPRRVPGAPGRPHRRRADHAPGLSAARLRRGRLPRARRQLQLATRHGAGRVLPDERGGGVLHPPGQDHDHRRGRRADDQPSGAGTAPEVAAQPRHGARSGTAASPSRAAARPRRPGTTRCTSLASTTG
jgi:hypothetical protein